MDLPPLSDTTMSGDGQGDGGEAPERDRGAPGPVVGTTTRGDGPGTAVAGLDADLHRGLSTFINSGVKIIVLRWVLHRSGAAPVRAAAAARGAAAAGPGTWVALMCRRTTPRR